MINCTYVSFSLLFCARKVVTVDWIKIGLQLSRLTIIESIKGIQFRYLYFSIIIPILSDTRSLLRFYNEMLINNPFSRSKQESFLSLKINENYLFRDISSITRLYYKAIPAK